MCAFVLLLMMNGWMNTNLMKGMLSFFFFSRCRNHGIVKQQLYLNIECTWGWKWTEWMHWQVLLPSGWTFHVHKFIWYSHWRILFKCFVAFHRHHHQKNDWGNCVHHSRCKFFIENLLLSFNISHMTARNHGVLWKLHEKLKWKGNHKENTSGLMCSSWACSRFQNVNAVAGN